MGLTVLLSVYLFLFSPFSGANALNMGGWFKYTYKEFSTDNVFLYSFINARMDVCFCLRFHARWFDRRLICPIRALNAPPKQQIRARVTEYPRTNRSQNWREIWPIRAPEAGGHRIRVGGEKQGGFAAWFLPHVAQSDNSSAAEWSPDFSRCPFHHPGDQSQASAALCFFTYYQTFFSYGLLEQEEEEKSLVGATWRTKHGRQHGGNSGSTETSSEGAGQ